MSRLLDLLSGAVTKTDQGNIVAPVSRPKHTKRKHPRTVDRSFLTKYQVVLPGGMTGGLGSHHPTTFEDGFVASSKDVICGRGKGER